jgi:hypothetical protein
MYWFKKIWSCLELLQFLARGGIHFTGIKKDDHDGAEWALPKL